MKRFLVRSAGLCAVVSLPLLAGYKIRPIEPKPASQYKAHIDFQNVVIGALAANSIESVLTLFDEKKIHEKRVMPVLVVIENRNGYALRVQEEDIYLILSDGTNVPPMTFGEAFLRVVLKKPPSSYSEPPGLLLARHRNKKKGMFEDFQHKHFGEKIIGPHSSDFGVLFFELPSEAEMSELRLYLPEIENISTSEALMFFEFNLR